MSHSSSEKQKMRSGAEFGTTHDEVLATQRSGTEILRHFGRSGVADLRSATQISNFIHVPEPVYLLSLFLLSLCGTVTDMRLIRFDTPRSFEILQFTLGELLVLAK